jgi:hypothetical protein
MNILRNGKKQDISNWYLANQEGNKNIKKHQIKNIKTTLLCSVLRTVTVDLCDNLQNFFWRVMLCVPESSPKIALRCETRMMGMKWRIWQEKILLLMRIKSQGMDTLCRQVYEEGLRMIGLD